MNCFRKMVLCAAAAALLLGTAPTAFAADGVYLEGIVEETALIKGVTYRHMKRLDDSGWQDIHIVRADLNEPHVK